ncbi:MAG: AraC family transcriptional regulator [Rhizobium sp.]|nr:MAG: AraC family transcriptional regulator [Rhizobium sp.]
MHLDGYALDTTWRTLLIDLGIRPADALRRAGLPDDLLTSSARVSSESYYRLWGAIEDLLGDPLLPIRLCEAVQAESFSPPLFAALCSPDLVSAAERIGRYKTLIAPMRLEVVRSRERVRIVLRWLDAPFVPPPSLVLMELLFCVQLARMGTREAINPIEVTAPEPPSPSAPYDAFLGVRIHRGEETSVTFLAADATRPFLTSNDTLWALFEPDLRQRVADLNAAVTTAKRVHAALLEGLPSGQVSMDAVAAKLGMSKRTLQRRIEAENTSFQTILRGVREALARHYLARTRLPLAEIAFLLGFDEVNSFHRAFRAWTGTTPDALRREQ